MTTTAAMNPSAAFVDPRHEPGEAELKEALGSAWPKVGKALHRLHAAHPEITAAWQFSPRSGWYQVQLQRKRRLLYLVPQRGGFRLMMILGRKAVATLQTGPFSGRVAALLKTARHYPEGIAFNFDRASLKPDLLAAFLEAKLSPGGPRP